MEKDVPVDKLHLIRENLATTEDEETDDDDSTFAFIYRQFRDFFIDNIPVEIVKQLPNYGKYFMGSLCYCLALGIFVYFTVVNYQNSVSQAYISLSESNGDCHTVPISITSNFLADNKGNWQGTANFLYYQAPFGFSFSNFEVDSLAQYQQMMGIYLKSLNYYGEIAEKNNLAIDLVIWMSFIRFYSTANPSTTDFATTGRGNLQYFQLTGDPTVVFQSRFPGLALGSSAGNCKLPASVIYDQANGVFSAQLNQEDAIDNDVCNQILYSFAFKQIDTAYNPYLTVQLDVRAFTTALAVNFGFIDIHNLMVANGEVVDIPTSYGTYGVGRFFDVRYPFMDSIFCIFNTTAYPPGSDQMRQLCFISTGGGFFLPVFNHMGTNLDVPEYCDCTTGIGKTSTSCNYFYLMTGLISFPYSSSGDDEFLDDNEVKAIVRYSLLLLSKHSNDYWEMNRAAYEASAATVFVTLNSSSTRLDNTSYSKQVFDFCAIEGGVTCSLVLFYALDQSNTLSEYHYPLINGSCRNSFKADPKAWSALTKTPPTPLNQIYFKCTLDKVDALINAVGVASGNTSIAMLVLLFVSVPTIFGFMACFRVIPREQEFKEKEKQIALDTFATLLLRVRDHHYEAIDQGGIVPLIAEEMVKSVAYSNFQIILEKEHKHDDANDADYRSRSFYIKSEPEDIDAHREFFGKIYLYRHNHKLRLSKDACQSQEEDHKYVMRSFSGNGKLFRGQSSKSSNFKLLEQKDNHDDVENQVGTPNHSSVLNSYRIRVMNLFEDSVSFPVDDPSWQVPYHGAGFSTVIEGLNNFFTNAIRNQLTREKNMSKVPENTPLYSVDVDYAKGCILSQELCAMSEELLLQNEDPALFVSLANALSMQASLFLNLDMRVISRDYSDRIGYQIGDKIFTYSVLTAYSLRIPVS